MMRALRIIPVFLGLSCLPAPQSRYTTQLPSIATAAKTLNKMALSEEKLQECQLICYQADTKFEDLSEKLTKKRRIWMQAIRTPETSDEELRASWKELLQADNDRETVKLELMLSLKKKLGSADFSRLWRVLGDKD